MHATLASVSWTPVDLANHLWQSSLIAVALLILTALCAQLSARTRLTLGWMALAKFALPFGFFAAFVTLFGGNPQEWPVERLFSKSAVPEVIAAAGPVTDLSAPGIPIASPAGADVPALPVVSLSPVWILDVVWLAGYAGLYGWWILGGVRLRRHLLATATEVSPAMAAHLTTAAEKAGIQFLPRCLAVRDGNGPGLLGVFSPILTLPHGLEENLTPAELESVLLHELIHLQRRDPFWLAMHVTAVSALWFNPVAWLLSRWIRLETEKACDERVLELTGRPDIYAQGILKVVHLALGLPEPRLLSVITPPVVSRVKNILRHESRPDRRWLRLAVLTIGAILFALGGSAGSLAKTIDLPVAPAGSRAPTVTGQPFTKGAGKYRFTPSGPTEDPRVTLELNFSSEAPTETLPTGELDRPESPVPAGTNATPSPFPEAPKFGPQFIPTLSSETTGAWETAFNPAPAATAGVTPHTTFSIDFPDADIRGIVRNVADLFELNIVIPETLQGRTSVKLRDVTWREAFKSILDPVGHTFVEEGKIIRIAPKASQTRPALSTEMFLLKTGHAEETARSLAALIDPASGGKIAVDVRANALVITETPANLEKLAKLLASLGLTGEESRTAAAYSRDVRDAGVLPVAPSQDARDSNGFVKLNPVDSVTAPPASGAPVTVDLGGTWGTNPGLDLDRIPRLLSQRPPVYPATLVERSLEGSVTVGFIVDPVGNLLSVRVLSSTHREFEPAALEAVKSWRFGGGRKGGKPVATNMSVVLNFHPPAAGKTSAIAPPAAVTAAAALTAPSDGLVADTTVRSFGRIYELKDLDVIPAPTLQVPAAYPADLKRSGVEGSVKVVFVVAETGLVQDVTALESTAPGFKAAAIATVQTWKFKPGRKDGKAVATSMEITLHFHLSGNR